MASAAGTPERAGTLQPDALFRAAADQAPQVMWIINLKGAVTYLNRSWYDLVGGAPPQWHGHAWGEVVVPEDLAEMRERWKAASAKGTIFEGTRRVIAQDGTMHVLSYKATPVRGADGRVNCWVGMDADITHIMATEAALRFANQELEAFSYSVSHDLRTPLVTILGFSNLLGKHMAGLGDTKAGHYLSRITEGVEHMGRLVDGLLALSHITRHKLDIKEVDLSKAALRIVDLYREQDPGRRVHALVQPGLVVRADESLVTVLLENLIGNAWKFTSRRPDAQIALELFSSTADEVVLVLRDNGAGFDMAHATELFGAFQRLHSDAEFPGTGVGLATVRRVVARHGGRVWAESAPGEGARFFFSFPLR